MWLDSQIGPYGQNTAAMAQNVRANASNILTGENPPYYCSDFLAAYPQFGGTSTQDTISVVAGNSTFTTTQTYNIGNLITDTTLNIPDGTTITAITTNTSTTTLAVTAGSNLAIGTATVGMLIVDSTGNIPAGTIVTAVSGTSVTMSNNATATASVNVTLKNYTITMSNNATTTGSIAVTVYTMLVPAIMLIMYVSLATSTLMQARWHSYWAIAVGWFIAHFLTLYLQGMAAPGSNAATVMAAAAARGITASKSVGPVSVSYDLGAINNDLDSWAAWKLTIYGQQLATFGNMVGKGGIVV